MVTVVVVVKHPSRPSRCGLDVRVRTYVRTYVWCCWWCAAWAIAMCFVGSISLLTEGNGRKIGQDSRCAHEPVRGLVARFAVVLCSFVGSELLLAAIGQNHPIRKSGLGGMSWATSIVSDRKISNCSVQTRFPTKGFPFSYFHVVRY